MVSSEDAYVTLQFRNQHIPASSNWIKACIEWCKQEFSDSCTNNHSLQKTVFSQWLDTDIRAEGIQENPQLQSSLLHYDKLMSPEPLKGIFVFQIMGWHDISKPAYSQQQKLLNSYNANTDVSAETQATQASNQNIPSQRMLKLDLSDGYSTVTAIEFESCSNKLKENSLRPGTKIKLIGPLTVRRGTILLRPKNIQLLGGYVEEIQSEAGLASKLKSILTPDAGSVSNIAHCNLPTQNYVPIHTENDTQLQTQQMLSRQGPLSTRGKRTAAVLTDDDDSIFSAIEVDEKIEEFDEEDDNIFQMIDTRDPKHKPKDNAKRINQATTSALFDSHIPTTIQNCSDDKKYAKTSPQTHEQTISSKPFQYLSRVSKAPGSITIIKGCVVTIAGSLSVKPGNEVVYQQHWNCSVIVTDGSENMKASISPKILETWIGASPTTYGAMEDDGKAKIKQNMKKISEKLISLNALMKISFIGNGMDPEIIEITDLNRGHAQQLKNRQKM